MRNGLRQCVECMLGSLHVRPAGQVAPASYTFGTGAFGTGAQRALSA